MAYNRTLNSVHIQAVVRQSTNRGRVGVLHVNNTDPKSGMLILNVLRLKHLHLQEVDIDYPD